MGNNKMTTEQLELKKKLEVKDPNEMIATSSGLMRVGNLERRVSVIEDEYELTHVIEYFDKPPIHRSVHVQLKEGTSADSVIESF